MKDDLPNLVERLQQLTGRRGEEEAMAWRASLPKLTEALAVPALDEIHVYFAGAGSVALEYQLPAASAWCDVVLLGQQDGTPTAVVIELKDWQTWGDRPGPAEGLMVRHGTVVLHPSDQVRGYVGYCQRFHSAVQDNAADVSGCVLFTRDHFTDSYSQPPNGRLAADYPCFTTSPQVVREAFPGYLTAHLTTPHAEFAKAFVEGTYQQERGFVRQIGEQILAPNSSPFVLLDNQRRAFAMVRARIEDALFSRGSIKKQVIIIDGPPGSGKSVLAAKIWAALVTDTRLPDGSVVLTTTSTSQTSNWIRLFQRAGSSHPAGGVIKRAASYVPVSPRKVGQLRKTYGPEFLKDSEVWRENVDLLRNLGVPFQDGARDDQYLVSIVDEAHALINPEHTEGRGQFGFAPSLGPLAWHIIRSSKVSIFLVDSEQGFRDRENTQGSDIKGWAAELNAELSDEISLKGAQFRCAGSKEYVDWVEAVLDGAPPEEARSLAASWQQVLDFRIVDTPADLEAALRKQVVEGHSARLLASFARPWKTRQAASPHRLPEGMQDFHEPYTTADGARRYWSRVWNYIPRNQTDYTWFIQGPEGSPIHDDPLCEVGCPYAVRGFDFDYVGILWLSDLVHGESGWHVSVDHVHESGLSQTLRKARRESSNGTARQQLRKALAQAYRILLTRGLKGVYLWFEDEATRNYIDNCLNRNS